MTPQAGARRSEGRRACKLLCGDLLAARLDARRVAVDVVIAVPRVVAAVIALGDVRQARVHDLPPVVRRVDLHCDAVELGLPEADDRKRLPLAVDAIAEPRLVAEPRVRGGTSTESSTPPSRSSSGMAASRADRAGRTRAASRPRRCDVRARSSRCPSSAVSTL